MGTLFQLRSFASGAAVALVGACAGGASGDLPGRTGTLQVDCVTVLGSPPPSAQTPYAQVAHSGAPRAKRISELSDSELGSLCDLDVCLRGNGYSRDCGKSVRNAPIYAVAVLGEFMEPCAPTDPHAFTVDVWDTREDCIQIYRSDFGKCHVGPWEDCIREVASDPLGAVGWGPDCATTQQECPLN